MSNYDYFNARIRAMSTELLTAEFYDEVLAVAGYDVLADSLIDSAYGPALRESLAVDHGASAVESALRRNLFQVFEKVRSLAPAKCGKLLNVQFLLWDVRNILAIVRGKLTDAAREDIVSAMFPAGEMDEPRLLELIGQPNARAVADVLVVWGFPLAFELRREFISRGDEIEPAQVETVLLRAAFAWGLSELAGRDDNERMVRRQYQRQIDLVNVMAILSVIRQREIPREVEPVRPIPGGLLGSTKLARIAASPTLEGAIEQLASTYFEPGVASGILAFGGRRRVGVLERYLEHVVIELGCKLFRTDPLAIGVSAGYVWRKFNEFLNLRILLLGKVSGQPASGIREELLIA